ncbi:MAG: hypothetical protein HA494_04440 [Thaumarchaeota archaeon]|nr:hypothetical protein [Nitrososphaerota archaeon]
MLIICNGKILIGEANVDAVGGYWLSILMLDRILRELHVSLPESEKSELYLELSRVFGFIGSYRECERLEEMWADPLYREAIEKYIEAWLNFRRRKSVIEAYG